jgi:hypothetical protein
MATKKTTKAKVGDRVGEIKFVDEPPPREAGRKGVWEDILKPLLDNPGIWGHIRECESVDQATDTVQNLNQRKVRIPQPQDNWEFVARDSDIYGIYHGKLGVNNAGVRGTGR